MTQTMHKTDQELKTAVTEELQYTPSIDESGIEVQVNEGTVTLSGQVASLPERLAAKHAAMRVGGVRNVTNKTAVHAAVTSGFNDQAIAHAASQLIEWAVDVPSHTVTVEVRDRKVTLSGRVAWDYQRSAAARAVMYLRGVTRISNEISLESSPPTADTKAGVEAALRRNAQLHPQGITVDLDGPELTLHGSVRSWSERREAERSAWSAAGVTSVHNELHITTS